MVTERVERREREREREGGGREREREVEFDDHRNPYCQVAVFI